MSEYVIADRKEGKDRLKLLSDVLQPTTSRLFELNGGTMNDERGTMNAEG